MKEIKLKCGNTVFVDDEDAHFLDKYSWRSHFDGWNWYVRRSTTINKKVKTFLLHRVILNITDKKVFVDHKDHNGMNNQKNNLRVCTPSENKKNTKGRGTSKYLGVSLKTSKYRYVTKLGEKKTSTSIKWEARIQYNKKQISIGLFNKEADAALAYNEYAIKFHGEFANLNKI